MKETKPVKYTDQLNFRTSRPMVSAVANAASARMCSINSWLRDAVLRKLEAEGRRLPSEREAA